MPWTRRITALLLAAGLSMQVACGTLLYPERQGQPRGDIDPTVAILNGLGLLLFVIPGLVAFAVDFHTGAIYLPADESAEPVVHMDPDEITPESLAAVIHEHTGKQVTFTEQDIEVMRVNQRQLRERLNDGDDG